MQGWKPRGSGAPGPPGPQQLIFSFSFFRARRLRFTALFPGRKDDASLLHKAYSHPSFTSPVWVGESFLSSDFQCFLLCSAGIISAAAPEASHWNMNLSGGLSWGAVRSQMFPELWAQSGEQNVYKRRCKHVFVRLLQNRNVYVDLRFEFIFLCLSELFCHFSFDELISHLLLFVCDQQLFEWVTSNHNSTIVYTTSYSNLDGH